MMSNNMKRICGEAIRTATVIFDSQIVEGFSSKEALIKVHYFIDGVRCAMIVNDNVTTEDFHEFNKTIVKFYKGLMNRVYGK